MYEPGVDVVVVNYRTPELIKDFIESYLYQDYPQQKSDLIIIDVDPTPETTDAMAEVLRPHRGKGFQYWPMDWNCGYSGACNFGATLGNREVVAFFNSDTRLFDDTLGACHHYLMDNDPVGICGPLQVDSSGLVTNAGIFGTNEKPTIRGWRSNRPQQFRDVRDDCVSVMGSAYFVKRHVWDELANDPEFLDMYPAAEGAFLPTPHYYEETWCSYFARHRGYKIAHVGTTMMVHEWHKSSKVGEVEGEVMRRSRAMFREACDQLGITHD